MLKLKPVAITDVGRKRNNNQDYLGDLIFKSGRKYGPEKLDERGYLFAVADGMGGYAGGEVASELAITTLFEQYYNAPSKNDIADDLIDAIRQANFQVHETSNTSGRTGMGTTLTLVLVKGNRGIFGNVGDSRVYLVRQGIPERVTHDHSLVQEQIDVGAITPEQAERSHMRNYITRAIGHRDIVESDLFERELLAGDVILLCSDGLHGQVKEIEMGTIVGASDDLEEAARQLVNLANERGGPDNISVMLVRIDEVGDPLPPILNGREAIYKPPPDTIYTQQTQPALQLAYNPDELATDDDRTTIPSFIAPLPSAATPLQATREMKGVGSRPRPGGRGLLLGLLLFLLVVAGVIAFVLLNNTTNTASPNSATATVNPVTTSPPVTTAAATTLATGSVAPIVPPTTSAGLGATTPTPGSGGTTDRAAGDAVGGAAGAAAIGSVAAGVISPVPPTAKLEPVSLNCQNCPISQVKQVRVQLTNPGSTLAYIISLRHKTDNTSWTFTPSGAGAGIFQANVDRLTPGQYALVVKSRDATTATSSDQIELRTDYEITLDVKSNLNEATLNGGTSLSQQNDTLLIVLPARTS